MSEEQLIEVVSKALIDSDFRTSLVDDPENTVQGYDLTDEELEMLKGIDLGTLESISTELEGRISRAGVNILGGSILGEISDKQFTAMEQNIQQESRRYQTILNALKAARQVAENAIQNLK